MAIATTTNATITNATTTKPLAATGKPDAPAEDKPPGSAATSKTEGKGTIVAAWILTLFYVSVAGGLLWHFGLGYGTGGNWERAVIIFNALSAIGFTAAGVLLGTRVQQVNVANAQKDAANAKAGEADAKRSEATVARHSEELADAAAKFFEKTLGKTSGTSAISGPALWSGRLPDPDDARLREAIMNMNEVLRRRAVD